MTRPDIESILSDGTKDTKYIIIYRADNSVNGIDLYPVIAKRRNIHIRHFVQGITLVDKKNFRPINFDRIENIVKCDSCIFGR